MESPSIARLHVSKVRNGQLTEMDDQLAVEEPLEIQLLFGAVEKRQKKSICVTMRTPGHDRELALGFLLTEGIIQSPSDVTKFLDPEGESNTILVELKTELDPDIPKAERKFYTTSSCGICGKSSIANIQTISPYLNDDAHFRMSADRLYGIHDLLREKQAVFDRTGGLHASALFDEAGNLMKVYEDVGRHNALDKLIGNALSEQQLPLNQALLLLSGRASFELIQKACMAGIRMIAAVGAPSSLAVETARENKITLIGFLRSDRFNIYSGEERIIFYK